MNYYQIKKTALFAACILLLFGGLFCLHLTAQPGSLIGSPAQPVSLVDLNIEETSERELLELKVAVHRNLVSLTTAAYKADLPSADITALAESHAHLAAAEAELYRYTGEQDKLRAALKEKAEALTDKLRGATLMFEAGALTRAVLGEAELQLLDALLELKQVSAPPHGT